LVPEEIEKFYVELNAKKMETSGEYTFDFAG
jgi:hypothetical protein